MAPSPPPLRLPDLGGLRLCPTSAFLNEEGDLVFTAEETQAARVAIQEFKEELLHLQKLFWRAARNNKKEELLHAYYQIRTHLDTERNPPDSVKGMNPELLAHEDPYFELPLDKRMQMALYSIFETEDGPIAYSPAAAAIHYGGSLKMALLVRSLAGTHWALAGKQIKEAFHAYTEAHKDRNWMQDATSLRYSTWLHLRNQIELARQTEHDYYAKEPGDAPEWWNTCMANPAQAPAWWRPQAVRPS